MPAHSPHEAFRSLTFERRKKRKHFFIQIKTEPVRVVLLFLCYFSFIFSCLLPDRAWDWFIIDFSLCFDCLSGRQEGKMGPPAGMDALGVLRALAPLALPGQPGQVGMRWCGSTTGGWWGRAIWARKATDASNDLAVMGWRRGRSTSRPSEIDSTQECLEGSQVIEKK